MKAFFQILKIFLRLKREELLVQPLRWIRKNFKNALEATLVIVLCLVGITWLGLFILLTGVLLAGKLPWPNNLVDVLLLSFAYGPLCLALLIWIVWLIVTNWVKAVREYREGPRG